MDALVPAPDTRTTTGGSRPAAVPWRITADDPALQETAEVVRQLAAPHIEPGAGPSSAELRLVLGDVPLRPGADGVPPGGREEADECYRVTVDAAGVTCRARTVQGVFRAAVSALQLIASGPQLAHQRIDDRPRYAWRGLMVDIARTFFGIEELYRIVDLAALYKLNVLHLHLTDDQGWRLEIPGRPALTDPAANRTHRADVPEGRAHLTPDEYARLQRYAAARFVTVVPEIDLPGHCAAIVRACPEVGTVRRPDRLDPRAPFAPPLDPRDPATRAFVTEVLTEVCRRTAGDFVHIGGDEVVGMDAETFTAAVRLARDVVRGCGKRPLGWQESARAGAGAQDVGQFWVDVPMMELPTSQAELRRRPELVRAGFTLESAVALARFFAPADGDLARIVRGGGKVLLSPQSHLYLDRPYDPAFAPAD